MPIEKLLKQTYRDNIYKTLREKIISGEILPGQTLTLRNLADQFGVSIIPVREAIAHLESEGVIVRRSNRDYRVSILAPAQFEEIYHLRELLECHIVRHICSSFSEPIAEKLISTFNKMDKELAQKKLQLYLAHNREFHFILYSAGNSPYLEEIISGLWARVGPYFSIHTQNADYTFSRDIHRKMLDAYIAKDGKSLLEALGKDICNSYKSLRPHILQQEQ